MFIPIFSSADKSSKGIVQNPLDAHPNSIQVLAACHSLNRFDEELVGDPLEKACLSWIDWNLSRSMYFYQSFTQNFR
jgi:cation-transporting ATPase 13A1